MKAIDRTISNTTAELIECKEQLRAINEKVRAALREVYTEDDVEKIVSRDFWAQYRALDKAIGNLILQNIDVNLSEEGGKAI